MASLARAAGLRALGNQLRKYMQEMLRQVQAGYHQGSIFTELVHLAVLTPKHKH